MNQTGMTESPVVQLEPPRLENGKPLLIAGLRSRYTSATMNNIPAQWQRFGRHIGKIPGQVGSVSYGVCWCPKNGAVDYLSGVEVSGSTGLPSDFSVVSIPAQRYAIFRHHGHVAKLRETLEALSSWLPESGYQCVRGAETPDFFERYTEDFDPRTGMGGIEVWVPIKT